MIRVLPIVNGVVTADFIGGNNSFKIFVTQDMTFQFSNPRQAQVAFVLFQQDSTGGHVVTFASNIKGVQYTESGANQTASIRFQYDDTSNSWYATAATSTLSQPSKTLYVDGTRTDTYVANGTIGLPFKTIMGAVNQVIANGDNSSTVPYLIDVVGPMQYEEQILLNDSHLINLYFEGNGAAAIHQNGATDVISCTTNPGLSQLSVSNFADIASDSGNAINLADAGNTGTFLSNSALFFNCFFTGNGIVFSNLSGDGEGLFIDCYLSTPIGLTADNSSVLYRNTQHATGGTMLVENGGGVFAYRSALWPTMNIADATSVISAQFTEIGWPGGGTTVTIKGTLSSASCQFYGAITIDSGGTFETSGVRNSTATVANSGTFTSLGTLDILKVELPNLQTILTGTGSPEGAVAAVVGSLYLRTEGGANTTLYVKESGTGNTGWAAK